MAALPPVTKLAVSVWSCGVLQLSLLVPHAQFWQVWVTQLLLSFTERGQRENLPQWEWDVVGFSRSAAALVILQWGGSILVKLEQLDSVLCSSVASIRQFTEPGSLTWWEWQCDCMFQRTAVESSGLWEGRSLRWNALVGLEWSSCNLKSRGKVWQCSGLLTCGQLRTLRYMRCAALVFPGKKSRNIAENMLLWRVGMENGAIYVVMLEVLLH